MYTERNFKSKKDLKAALTAGENVMVFDTAVIGALPQSSINGTVYLEGPHYPEPHRWYAQAKCESGRVVSVK
jgi:hypothetical protein